MRMSIVAAGLTGLLAVAALAAPPAGSDNGADQGSKSTWHDSDFQVELSPPSGFAQTVKKPHPLGAWLELSAWAEKSLRASMTLCVQQTAIASSKAMEAALRSSFNKDSDIAILNTSPIPATRGRPSGIYFEYTFRVKGGPQHAIAAYWYFLGRRYRVYALAPETNWKKVSSTFAASVSSFALTSRAFRKDLHNLVDDRANCQIWVPKSFKISIGDGAPQLTLTSKNIGMTVWLYVVGGPQSLDAAVKDRVEKLGSADFKVLDQKGAASNPVSGLKVAYVDYQQESKGTTYRYREALFLHLRRLYRLVLATKSGGFQGGLEIFDRIVSSFGYLR